VVTFRATMTGDDAQTRCFQAHPDYALGSWGSLFICSWRVHTTVEGARDLTTMCARFADSHPNGIGLLTIIEERAPAPDGEARAKIADFLGQAEYIKASGVAFEGSGFRAAMVRSIIAGLSMIARQPYPHRVFSNLTDTLDWLIPEFNERTNSNLSQGTAERAIERFRHDVDARCPKASTS